MPHALALSTKIGPIAIYPPHSHAGRVVAKLLQAVRGKLRGKAASGRVQFRVAPGAMQMSALSIKALRSQREERKNCAPRSLPVIQEMPDDKTENAASWPRANPVDRGAGDNNVWPVREYCPSATEIDHSRCARQIKIAPRIEQTLHPLWLFSVCRGRGGSGSATRSLTGSAPRPGMRRLLPSQRSSARGGGLATLFSHTRDMHIRPHRLTQARRWPAGPIALTR